MPVLTRVSSRYCCPVGASIRVGIRGSSTLPIPGPPSGFEHVIEVSDSPDGRGVTATTSTGLGLRAAVGCHCAIPGEAITRSRALVLTRDRRGALAQMLEIESCPHITLITATDQQSIPDASTAISRIAAPDLATLASICVRDAAAASPRSNISQLLVDELRIHLSRALKTKILAVEPARSFAPAADGLDLLAQRRRLLGEIEEFAHAAHADASDITLVQGAIERADSELQIASATQLYRLVANTIELRQLTEKNEETQKRRERRWARAGAATIPPLAFLGLAGANTVPIKIHGEPVQAPIPFFASAAITALLSWAAYAWAKRLKE